MFNGIVGSGTALLAAIDGTGVANIIKDIISQIQIPCYALCGLAIVLLGISLIFGNDKMKDMAKSKAAMIIIGAALVCGGVTLGSYVVDSLVGGAGGV